MKEYAQLIYNSEDGPFEKLINIIGERLKGTRFEHSTWVCGNCVTAKLLGYPLTSLVIVSSVGLEKELAEFLCKSFNCYEKDENPKLYQNFHATKFNLNIQGLEDIRITCMSTLESTIDANGRSNGLHWGTIFNDARRKTVTINSLYVNMTSNRIYDPLNTSLKDLQEKTLRLPKSTINEFKASPIKMLDIIKYASNLEWDIDKDTWFSIIENADCINSLTQETITSCLNSILTSKKPSIGLLKLKNSGLLNIVLPEIESLSNNELSFNQMLKALDSVKPNKVDRWVALYHNLNVIAYKNDLFSSSYDISAKGAEVALKKMKFTETEIKDISTIISNLDFFKDFKGSRIGRKLRRFKKTVGDVLYEVAADIIYRISTAYSNELCTEEISKILSDVKSVDIEPRNSKRNNVFPFSGKDIMEMFNLKQSPIVGSIISYGKQLYENKPTMSTEEFVEKVMSTIKV